jgi:RNA polymerase-binding transcription factor DksA
VGDAADKAADDEARAWDLFEANRRERDRLSRARYPIVDRQCLECGEPISEARRLAAPGSCRCVHCATRAESR